MGVFVNDKIVAAHCSTGKFMWELALWYRGCAPPVMLVEDGHLSHLATKSGEEILHLHLLCCCLETNTPKLG